MKYPSRCRPVRATPLSAGYDFVSPDRYDLVPGEWTTIDTKVAFEDTDIVRGSDLEPVSRWVMLLFPRSGLSRVGFRLRNTVGVIDMDYRDTIKAVVTVDRPYTIAPGQRILQGVIVPFCVFDRETGPVSEKRTGGFGSTGGCDL